MFIEYLNFEKCVNNFGCHSWYNIHDKTEFKPTILNKTIYIFITQKGVNKK